ncbi:MAG TPA: response regulator transcription factor [Pyrinomonadaceae bacterium]|nr:response regulator transcription factor [Pyrinomonadaceae bacterium]
MADVLIIDDHPIVRRGLKEILQGEEDLQLAEASDAAEALQLMKQNCFALVILDLDLPGTNGLDLLKEIRRNHKKSRVLVLSIYPEDQFAVRVLKSGASGFLSKDAAPEQLSIAIRKILQGSRYITERTADLLLQTWEDTHDSHLHEKLSDREFQILCLLGQGKRTKEIATTLMLSPPTVGTYRARILEKLRLRTTADLVKYAVQNRLAI